MPLGDQFAVYWLDHNISQRISVRSLAHFSFAVESRGSRYGAGTSGRKEGRVVAIRQFLLVVHYRDNCWVRRCPAHKKIGEDSCYRDRSGRVDVNRHFNRGSCSRCHYRSCGTRCRENASMTTKQAQRIHIWRSRVHFAILGTDNDTSLML